MIELFIHFIFIIKRQTKKLARLEMLRSFDALPVSPIGSSTIAFTNAVTRPLDGIIQAEARLLRRQRRRRQSPPPFLPAPPSWGQNPSERRRCWGVLLHPLSDAWRHALDRRCQKGDGPGATTLDPRVCAGGFRAARRRHGRGRSRGVGGGGGRGGPWCATAVSRLERGSGAGGHGAGEPMRWGDFQMLPWTGLICPSTCSLLLFSGNLSVLYSPYLASLLCMRWDVAMPHYM